MSKLTKMAWGNVWRNSRRTIIVLVAVSLGLALLLFFDGMFGGSRQAMYGNAVKLQGGNLLIHAPGYRERLRRMPLIPLPDDEVVLEAAIKQPGVTGASRRINTSGMVSSREGTLPIAIIGIEPEREAETGLLAKHVIAGRYLEPGDGDVLLAGKAMAEWLGVSVGDRVTMVGRATHEQMRQRTMTVVGIFDLGLPEVEKGTLYISLSEAQTLLDLREQSTEVVISLEAVGQEDRVLVALRNALPGYEVDTWYTLNPEMMQAFAVNEQVMGVFGLVVLLISAVGILNIMLMAVYERTREIGILAALGLKRRQILTLFLQEGVLLGLVGVVSGGILGGVIVWYFSQVGLAWGATEYSEITALMGDRIYFRMGVGQLLARALTVGFIAALASLYPAWQASRKEPADALHYV